MSKNGQNKTKALKTNQRVQRRQNQMKQLVQEKRKEIKTNLTKTKAAGEPKTQEEDVSGGQNKRLELKQGRK